MSVDSIKIGRRLFMVEIKAFADDAVVKTMGPFTERTADKVERGLNRNLDHERFYTACRRATAAEILADPSPSRSWWT